MKRIKVLHLLATDRFSGAENVVCQIIKMYKEFIMVIVVLKINRF